MQLLLGLCLLVLILVCSQGFDFDARLYGLTVKGSIGLNAFKVVFVIETSFFLTLGLLIEMAGLFWRYLFLGIRHRFFGLPGSK
jgi:hypothetical protein